MRARTLPDWIRERPFAHRGLHDLRAGLPENTLGALEAAVNAGYAVELDLHLLRDGALVVFHDDDLTRAAGRPTRLAESDYGAIRGLGLFGTEHRIPLLAEVLRLVAGRVPLLLEIKQHGSRTQVASALHRALADYAGPFAVQSFNPFVLGWFQRHAPSSWRGQLGGPLREDPFTAFEKFASRSLLTALLSRPHFLNYDLRALPDAWVQRIARLGRLPLLCWTVRSEADRQKAERLGLNYVFEGIRP